MNRFTKQQMLEELQTIFLFEADHILMGAGPEMAEAFIGFPMDEADEYCGADPQKVDLTRFGITSAFEHGYEFAFRPSVMNQLGEHQVQDLNTFMDGTPRAGGISSGGETHRFMTSDGYCRTVADTVFARWKLEWDHMKGHTFTTRELALLANMTEGAIRNALSDRSENGLRAIPGSKPVSVEYEEALRWLPQRRGFIQSPARASDDRFLAEYLKDIGSSEALGRLIRQRVSSSDNSSILGWDAGELDAWCNGTFLFDVEKARYLAIALDLDVPLFVGKALEVALRRDAHGSLSS